MIDDVRLVMIGMLDCVQGWDSRQLPPQVSTSALSTCHVPTILPPTCVTRWTHTAWDHFRPSLARPTHSTTLPALASYDLMTTPPATLLSLSTSRRCGHHLLSLITQIASRRFPLTSIACNWTIACWRGASPQGSHLATRCERSQPRCDATVRRVQSTVVTTMKVQKPILIL